jgi:hypothetical protein
LSDAKAIGWAAWHPEHGFEIPYFYEGSIVFADLDGMLIERVRGLNREGRTTNRTGWRAVKVSLVRVPS